MLSQQPLSLKLSKRDEQANSSLIRFIIENFYFRFLFDLKLCILIGLPLNFVCVHFFLRLMTRKTTAISLFTSCMYACGNDNTKNHNNKMIINAYNVHLVT